jgi:hypothetical protein
MEESTERELYGDLRAITSHQKSKFLLYFESSCIVITRSKKLARVITSKSVVKNSVLPTAAKIILYSKIVVLQHCVWKFLFIASFRWYGDFFDVCNIFLNRLRELLLIKISNIRKKPNTILKLTSLVMYMSCENLRQIRYNPQENNSFKNQ